MSLLRTDVKAHRGITPDTAPLGYGPPDFQSAYNLPSATAGSGETVAIVDAGDDPTAEADLGVYRQQYGLPACTTANGCFEKVNQEGQQGSYPPVVSGWPVEESLDVDMVSAICPDCRILLVEANSALNTDLDAAENEAVTLGAKFVSNSWGSCESSGDQQENTYFNHPGVAITVAGGDSGYDNYRQQCSSPNWPAASQYVTSVGGTSLTKDSGVSRGWSEAVWADTGSGCSIEEPKPSWQTDTGCANRTSNDVSADADPATGAAIYDTNDEGGWLEVGGTSEAAPIIAAVYALAGAPVAGTYPASYPYAASSALNDVTSGSNYNQSCTPAYLCTAGPGYDGPTGLGTPNGVAAFTGGPHGNISGEVTVKATGKPLAGATVSTGQGYTATTSISGNYDLALPAGSYSLAVNDFGYKPQTVTGVSLGSGQTVTENFTLSTKPRVTLSGTVTDGSGQTYPLFAQVSVAGDPDGPVYTNPYTGAYNVSIPRNAKYRLQVAPVQMVGYQTRNQAVTIGAADTQQDIKLLVDKTACTAPGYAEKTTSTGTVKCAAVRGGLVAGQVTDHNTGDPVNGATVTSVATSAETATTGAAPGVGNGFYELFAAPTGSQQFTAVSGRYSADTESPTVTANTVQQQDFSLQAGDLTITPGSLSATVALGNTASKTVIFTNDGTEPINMHLDAQDNGFTPMGATAAVQTVVPVQRIKAHVTPRLITPSRRPRRHEAKPGIRASSGTVPGQRTGQSAPSDEPWAGIADYPTAIQDSAVAYNDGIVYSVGGYTGSGATAAGYAYDTVSQQWDPIASAPTAVEQAKAVFVDGTLYLIGGWTGKAGVPSSGVYGYDPSANTWSQLASMPVAAAAAGVAVLDNEVYVVGGCTGNCQPGTASVQRYDPASDTWTLLAGYPQPVSYEACAGIGSSGELACAGGLDNSSDGLTSTYVYDPGTDTWSQAANMPYDDWGMAYASASNMLQVVGGVTANSTVVTNQAAQFDPATNTWSALPNADNAEYRGGGSCGLYQIGGNNGSAAQSFAQVLPGYDQCTSVPWLSESNTSLDLAPGQSAKVTVTMAASAVSQPGTYQAGLTVTTNAPYRFQPVGITLQVNPPKSWGKITGTVTDASTGSPIAGATIQICTMYDKSTGTCGPVSYTLTTDSSGSYQLWLPHGYSPLEVIASQDGYQPQVKVVTITQGAVTTASFTLTPA
jgi:N-acetylneuraminic acid mutarotase